MAKRQMSRDEAIALLSAGGVWVVSYEVLDKLWTWKPGSKAQEAAEEFGDIVGQMYQNTATGNLIDHILKDFGLIERIEPIKPITSAQMPEGSFIQKWWRNIVE